MYSHIYNGLALNINWAFTLNKLKNHFYPLYLKALTNISKQKEPSHIIYLNTFSKHISRAYKPHFDSKI